MPEKPNTLAEFKLPHMVLRCAQCGRKGRYNVARLVEKHGPEMTIRDFVAMIGQSCHRWTHPVVHQSCGLGCDDLIYMFMPKPAAEGYAEQMQTERG
ncbi:hypothetical protein [Sinorhizobium fredii]|uniref:hypothetical protein n=1 Tax=Rhizobium fredii TaxID=380 RepID=UPI0004B65BEB|nr:hypothetical protein [Sinorhizobium fredii]